MKILYVATVRSHVGQFHIPFIERLNELGCTVDGAYSDNSEQKQGLDTSALNKEYDVPFSRSPYSASNLMAYKVLKKIINENDYDAVHCHTPMGGVVARLAVKNSKKKNIKVIYTVHGFHFYKGSPKFNWTFFYPVEKYLSNYTDCIVTINNEDYELAQTDDFKAAKIFKVDGVGVDLTQFSPVTKEEKAALREEYGFSQNDFIMIYPADFCERKNQMMLLKALEIILQKHKNVKLLMPGLQDYIAECQQYIDEHNLGDYAIPMGYRRDIPKLIGLSDLSLSSSRQEGLPINLIEAMAMGNAIVTSDVRGNNDLVQDGVNGYLVKLNDSETMAERINYLIENPEIIEKFGKAALELVQKYSVENAVREMEEIYKELELI